jgi:hypothetical protein
MQFVLIYSRNDEYINLYIFLIYADKINGVMMSQKNKKSKKKIGLYILYGAVTIAILSIILGANDFDAIFNVMANADIKYVLIAIALLVLYMALSPLTTCLLTRAKKLNIPFITTYSISMTEHFFNGITPFSTGGQPFQIYEFNRAKVKAADSTGVLLMNFIIMMIVTNAFAICSLFYYGRFIGNDITMQIIAIIGFSMNFLVLFFMIALATSKRMRNLLFSLGKVACKIKFIAKFLEPKLEAYSEYLTNMQQAFKFLFTKTGTFISCLIIRAITMAVYYAITFYILLALGVDVGYNELFFVICGSSFAITAVVFLPTPGSSGGIEFAFKSIFFSLAGGAVTETVAYGGMLIWRLLTYYLLMGISLMFYIGLEIYFNVKSKMAVKLPKKIDEGAGKTSIAPNICANEIDAEGN